MRLFSWRMPFDSQGYLFVSSWGTICYIAEQRAKLS